MIFDPWGHQRWNPLPPILMRVHPRAVHKGDYRVNREKKGIPPGQRSIWFRRSHLSNCGCYKKRVEDFRGVQDTLTSVDRMEGLMKVPVIWLALATFALISESAGQVKVLQYKGTVLKGSQGKSVTFPDICKTPSGGSPVSVPYPNVGKSQSDFRKGTKKTKAGGKLQISETKVKMKGRNQTVYNVRLVDESGQEVTLSKSRLIELEDGSFCAVCVNKNGAVIALLSLAPARAR